jgi:hypothetical protein
MMKSLPILLLVVTLMGTTSSLAEDKGQGTDVASSKQPTKGNEAIPTTLEEAHLQLERQFSKEELAKIDAMKSEDEMTQYHFGLGMDIRNGWELWKGSALAQHMRKLGFIHPDDISAVILATFWCKRHGKDFRLKERADYYAAYWKAEADPPPTAKDPKDGSEIDWSVSLRAGDKKTPQEIHVGRSKKTGRWLAYEYNKGVYVPGAELQKRINESDKQK